MILLEPVRLQPRQQVCRLLRRLRRCLRRCRRRLRRWCRWLRRRLGADGQHWCRCLSPWPHTAASAATGSAGWVNQRAGRTLPNIRVDESILVASAHGRSVALGVHGARALAPGRRHQPLPGCGLLAGAARDAVLAPVLLASLLEVGHKGCLPSFCHCREEAHAAEDRSICGHELSLVVPHGLQLQEAGEPPARGVWPVEAQLPLLALLDAILVWLAAVEPAPDKVRGVRGRGIVVLIEVIPAVR
mmetsp:Transcript_61977/g.165824  ORF Transcript_61977/g.165824 Transcript_61977/m.165824 type:complete len:245 (-) Transcript_61977:478-1212(-)